jgi:hypothetical protein
MYAAATLFVLGDPKAILERHAIRRSAGLPTVSVLVGPIGGGIRAWRRWVADTGRSVIVANGNLFPYADWVRIVAEQIDLPVAAVLCLAQRADRDPDEFLLAWRAKTAADRERFWSCLAPKPDDDLLRAVATLAVDQGSRITISAVLSSLGEKVVPMILRLAPSTKWPGIMFLSRSTEEFLSTGRVAMKWAMRVPALPVAIAVPAGVWDEFLITAPESRTKALLREGETPVPMIDAATFEHALTAAGAPGRTAAAVAADGADAAFLESAVAAVLATATSPTTQAEDNRARSAAERFLFEFLESLPEAAGRFELNAVLDFRFGPRPAEVDLLCRSPRIAIELDGYFHFLAPDGYRRDRTKDWELQRRGFVVLRFLAADVIPQLEMIRDRILDALNVAPLGAHL